MNRRRLPLALACVPVALSCLLLPCAASADNITGWYAGGNIGFDIPVNQNLTFAGNGVTNQYSAGFVGGIRGGYSFGNGLRPELEFNYHRASIQNSTIYTDGLTAPVGAASGSESAKTLLADAWYDFRQPDGMLSVIYPYVGAGIGVADVSISSERFSSFQGSGGTASGSSTVIAYQIGFGANYQITPYLVASADFRYLMTTNFAIPGQTSGDSDSSRKLVGAYREPSLFVGLNYKFGGGES